MLVMQNLRLQSITPTAEYYSTGKRILLVVIDLLAYKTVFARFLQHGVSNAAAYSDEHSVSGQWTCIACCHSCNIAKAATFPFLTDYQYAVEYGAFCPGVL